MGVSRVLVDEVVRTCTERGKQFKVLCRLKLRHVVSFGFIHRLASVSSKFNTFCQFLTFSRKEFGFLSELKLLQ